MIFVTVGTQPAPFDRLLEWVGDVAGDEQVVAQTGTSSLRPAGVDCVPFMPYEELVEHVRQARVIVAHAGVGSTLVAVTNRKRPLVVPRLRELGEHPDDHQHEFARRLEAAGLVNVVEDKQALRAALRAVEPALSEWQGPTRLVAALRSELERRIGPPPG